jgi:hypothetical protein
VLDIKDATQENIMTYATQRTESVLRADAAPDNQAKVVA